MYRKFLTLVLIAGSLGLILFVKSFLFEQPKAPRLIDRLPTADFLAKANILELAKETNSLLQYNKLSMRDFTTYEFLLGQGKQYGIDLEANMYLFANENGNWGALLRLNDFQNTRSYKIPWWGAINSIIFLRRNLICITVRITHSFIKAMLF